MNTSSDSTPVQLHGRAGLLAAVPALLGFHPTNSLVMVCLRGARHTVGPVLRVDLEPDDPEPARALVRHAENFGAEVAVLAYPDRPGRPPLLDRTVAGLYAAGIRVLDALLVRSGWVWPIRTCPGEALGPVESAPFAAPDTDDEQVRAMAAAIALNGRTILPDRTALARSVSGPTGPAAARAAACFDAAADHLLELLERERMTDPDPVVQRAQQVAAAALAAVGARGSVPAELAAELALLVDDVAARDAIIRLAVADTDDDWLPLLISVAAAVLDRDASAICCILALAAYRRGDGALALVAAERCLHVDPDNRLAQLLLCAIDGGLPPDELGALVDAPRSLANPPQ